MRRPLAFLLLTAIAALAGLRLAAAVQDTEAMRCAIACGHAASAVKGAACCPMAGAKGGGLAFKACGRGGLALMPLAPVQPAVLASAAPLEEPRSSLYLDPASDSGARSRTPRPLDHVPLLLG